MLVGNCCFGGKLLILVILSLVVLPARTSSATISIDYGKDDNSTLVIVISILIWTAGSSLLVTSISALVAGTECFTLCTVIKCLMSKSAPLSLYHYFRT